MAWRHGGGEMGGAAAGPGAAVWGESYGQRMGVGRVSMCCRLGGRCGQLLDRTVHACDAIESCCFELWTSQNGYTALIVAAECGHRDVVGLLLDRGADMEAKNEVSRPFRPLPNVHGRAGGSWAGCG